MPRTTKADLVQVASDIFQTARDNAIDTVLENSSKEEQAKLEYLDQHPQFSEWLRGSVDMVLTDWSGRAAESYGRKPLTEKQSEQVRKILIKTYHVEI